MKKNTLNTVIAVSASITFLLAGCGSAGTGSTPGSTNAVLTTNEFEPIEVPDIAILRGADVDVAALVASLIPEAKEVSADTKLLNTSIAGQVTITYIIQTSDTELEDSAKVYVIAESDVAAFHGKHPDIPIYMSTSELYVAPDSQQGVENATADGTAGGDAEQPGAEGTHTTGTNTGTGGSTGGSPGGNSGGSTGGNNNQQPTHTHSWEPVYDTVHHDEVGHYETQTVSEAWDEPVYETLPVCSACGNYYYSVDEVSDHIIFDHDGLASYSVKRVQTGSVHHEAVTQEVWVVDQATYDEQVLSGYRCSCGAIK